MIESKSKKRKPIESRVNSLKLIGGRPCLDFANTVDWRTGDRRKEMLDGYTDLIVWSQRVGFLRDDEADILLAQAEKQPGPAEKVFTRAIQLREAIFAVFWAAIKGEASPNRELKLLNTHLSRSLGHLQIIHSQGGFTWEFKSDPEELERILYPIARSAGELLASEDLTKVKICLDADCGWLFLDTSRNQRRCWCDMRDCGNRAKARRFYTKKKTKV